MTAPSQCSPSAPPGRDGTGSAEQLTEIAELITAAGGRTLGLFSSMRAARAAAEAMRERLETPVLCQGDAGTAALVEHLLTTGTRKLFAEVDVENTPSIRLLERLGFTREALFREHETTHKGLCDVAVYGLLASDSRPSK